MGGRTKGNAALLASAAVAGAIGIAASVGLVLVAQADALRCSLTSTTAGCSGFSLLAAVAAGGFLVALVLLAIRRRSMAMARAPSASGERLLIASALAVILGVVFVYFRAGADGDGSRPEDPGMASAAMHGRAGDLPQGGSPGVARNHSARPARHPFPEIPRSRRGLPLETDPFMAESVAEQQWLDRHGYPNEQQWTAYASASDAQLEAAAQAGDRSAEAMLAQRQLIQGDDAALDRMLKAGAGGNTFALELLASTMAGPKKDPMLGYALSRVVELRGNIRVGFNRDVMFNTPLSPLQRIEAETEAADLYIRLLRLQKTIHGNNTPASDVRPIGD